MSQSLDRGIAEAGREGRSYESNRDLLTSVENQIDTSPVETVSKYEYINDSVGRRTSTVLTGTAFTGGSGDHHWDYGYNDRSELTGGNRKTGTSLDQGGLMTPGDFDYAYDPIGNRTSSNVDNAANPTGYTANAVNAYTATTYPTESFSHDDDGNLTADGTFTHVWDAENRLKEIRPTSPSQGSKKLVFQYDYMGRRVRKAAYTYDSGWPTSPAEAQVFIYDGWNPVLVLDGLNSNAVKIKYTWGLDMSGQAGTDGTSGIHGAGGISGLLASVETGTTGSPVHWYFYDGNGNVGQVLDATNTSNITTVARYEYDPYGNNLSATGTYATSNPFRFSTKWFDVETGLYYYGYRYYNARLGRWMSRDPIQEWGGRNLFGFVGNSPTNQVDLLGMNYVRPPAYVEEMMRPPSFEGGCPFPPDPDFPVSLRPTGKVITSYYGPYARWLIAEEQMDYYIDPSVGFGTNLSAITTAAKYEYDPYGITLAATGTYAAANPFRFSTKWFDTETGLGYWGYRYYSPRLGRWISRDPVGEAGGLNAEAMEGNDVVNRTDPWGLTVVVMYPGCPPPCSPKKTFDAVRNEVSDCGHRVMEAVEASAKSRGISDRDRWKHCVTSCRIPAECALGFVALPVAATAKECSDIHEHRIPNVWIDSAGDQVANSVGYAYSVRCAIAKNGPKSCCERLCLWWSGPVERGGGPITPPPIRAPRVGPPAVKPPAVTPLPGKDPGWWEW